MKCQVGFVTVKGVEGCVLLAKNGICEFLSIRTSTKRVRTRFLVPRLKLVRAVSASVRDKNFWKPQASESRGQMVLGASTLPLLSQTRIQMRPQSIKLILHEFLRAIWRRVLLMQRLLMLRNSMSFNT
ncbi:hypothetical protein EBS43_03915 [bacterium]|nr:hypothetical protein [bacterium]